MMADTEKSNHPRRLSTVVFFMEDISTTKTTVMDIVHLCLACCMVLKIRKLSYEKQIDSPIILFLNIYTREESHVGKTFCYESKNQKI